MAKIVPIASGKGGVGKSLFVSNLSLILSEMGHRVLAVDLDLGGSNLHTMLGIKNDLEGLGHFINDKEMDFSEVIHKTQYDNLDFVPGDALFVGTANLRFFRKRKIIRELAKLDYDWVFLDLGAGTSSNTLDFYLMSSRGVIVTSPDITSILNAYSFIKNAFFKFILKHYHKRDPIRVKLSEAGKMRLEKDDLRLYEYVRLLKKDFPGEAEKIDSIINDFYPTLVINMAEDKKHLSLGENLRNIIHKNIGIDVEYLGLLPKDKSIEEAVLQREPLFVVNPSCKWMENCRKIADRLVNFENFPIQLYPDDDFDSVDVVIEDFKDI